MISDVPGGRSSGCRNSRQKRPDLGTNTSRLVQTELFALQRTEKLIGRTKKKPKLPPYVVLKFDPPEWHVKVSFPTRQKDSKGRTVYEQMTRRCLPETKERAAEIVAFLRAEYKKHLDSGISKQEAPTVTAFLEYFLSQKRRSVSARTADDYQKLYNSHIKDTSFSKRRLAEVSPINVQDLYNGLEVSGSQARKIHVFLSMAFTQAVAWEKISRNPATGSILPAYERQETLSLTDDEVRRVIPVCREDDEFIMFDFDLETGLRPQELLAIRWSDLEIEKFRVHVRQAIAFAIRGMGNLVKLPKTSKSRRTVEFSPEVAERLKRHRENYLKRLDDSDPRSKSRSCCD